MDAGVITSVGPGTVLTILAVEKGGSMAFGNTWYKVAFNSGSAYLAANDAQQEIIPASTSTPQAEAPVSSDWAAVLNSFPPSYRAQLTALHEKYPSWNFVPLNIPYTLARVVKAETANVSRNLVPNTYRDYVLSYTVRETPNWVSISPNALLYLMDPRNMLAEDNIFQFERVTTDGNQKATQTLTNMFSGNAALIDMIPAIEKVANEEGLLPTFLAARIKQEVSTGSGVAYQASGEIEVTAERVKAYGFGSAPASALWPNTRYYNVFNIGAYNGDNPALNGIMYATGLNPDTPADVRSRYDLPWNSVEKSIRGGSRWIRSAYVDAGQNTQYLQKYNVNTSNLEAHIHHQYMGNALAPLLEGRTQYNAYKDAGELALSKTFLIPVYQDSPATPAPYPTANDGSWVNQAAEVWTNVEATPTTAATTAPTQATEKPANLGDANGDGKINIFDMIAVQEHIKGISNIPDNLIGAADVNHDGTINIFDMIAIQEHIKGISLIA